MSLEAIPPRNNNHLDAPFQTIQSRLTALTDEKKAAGWKLRQTQYPIKREERFCKTSVGWVLRQYSKHNQDYVRRFLEDHREWTTPEVVKNAMKYISKDS